MTVAELIAELQKMPQDAVVLVRSYDECGNAYDMELSRGVSLVHVKERGGRPEDYQLADDGAPAVLIE